jgi:outer membrane lipoprotein-sorting protein
MNKKTILTLVIGLAVISMASAQNLDKILDSHFKAVGQKNLEKIKTIQAKGKASAMGMDMPFTMSIKRPDKMKIVIDVQGAEIIQAVDGTTVWAVNPMMGSSAAMVLTGAEAEGLQENADLDGQLWNYNEKGHQLALEGSEEVNGKDCYVLKLTKKNGNTDYYFLDKDSYLIQKVRTTTMMNGSAMEVEAIPSNYNDVDGYKMAFKTEQRAGGQTMMTLTYDNVEANVDMDDAMFAKPDN